MATLAAALRAEQARYSLRKLALQMGRVGLMSMEQARQFCEKADRILEGIPEVTQMPDYKQETKPTPGSLKVVELFETVQGEGIYIGVPSVFFRTGMCNLACPGCDTKWDTWTETALQECAAKILCYDAKHVVFTGGEPTLWQDELTNLMELLQGRTLTVESNGSVPIRNERLLDLVDLWSFSPKVGSLGHDEKFSKKVVLNNIYEAMCARPGRRVQIKYVLDPHEEKHVDSVFDFQSRVDEMAMLPDDRVFFQPYDKGTAVNIYSRITPFNDNEYSRDLKVLTELVLRRSNSRFRVVPQLHKYISYR